MKEELERCEAWIKQILYRDRMPEENSAILKNLCEARYWLRKKD